MTLASGRLTFREKSEDICWQKKLRDKYLAEGMPPVSLDLKKAVVKPVSRNVAKQIILKYEWLGTLPIGTNLHYGIFFGAYCAGVTCIVLGSVGGNKHAHKPFGIQREELAYLTRGANVHWSPPGANSKLVSWTCRLLAKDTRAKLVIAFSDTDAGEVGTIYQASNWICVGKGEPIDQWVSPEGRVYNLKLSYDLKRSYGGTHKGWADAMKQKGWTLQKSNPKYKYVYQLDKTDRALALRLEAMRQPYPKRPDTMRVAEGGSLITSQVERFDPDSPALSTGDK